MVMIVGWGAGEARDFGEIAPATCPNCANQVFLHHIRSDKRVSLFFIPLASYGSNEYLACPICRSGLQLRPENRHAVEEMRALTSMIRRGAIDPGIYRSKVEQFWRRLGVDPAGTQRIHPATTVPSPATVAAQPAAAQAQVAAPSLREQLEGLAQLHADGVLSDDEFAAAKRRLLGI